MENKLCIGFHLENNFGNNYEMESTVGIYTEFGETELSVIGEQLNCFLKQCGYVRSNDYIFMADVTEVELEALADYLEELREDKK